MRKTFLFLLPITTIMLLLLDLKLVCSLNVEASSLIDAGRETPKLDDDVLEVVKSIEERYSNHPGFRHYFWQFMAKGDYDLQFLRKYALHYYEHVRVFRLYLAGAMTAVPVEEFQVTLSEIIADEFGVRLYNEPDVDGHPKLFRRFMRSLGLTEDDWETVSTGKNLIEGIAHYKRIHYGLFNGGLAEEIVGAIIFGMERTTPHRHSRVLDGLKKFSDRTGHEIDWQFFSEHVGVDDYHNNALLFPLQSWFLDPVKVDRMMQGATASFDARKGFLDDLALTMGITKPPTTQSCTASLSSPVHIDKMTELVKGVEWMPLSSLHVHEDIDEERRLALLAYMNITLQQQQLMTISAISVSIEGVVIDGHHRLSALASLGYTEVPCCIINYDHKNIRVHGSTKIRVKEFATQHQHELMPPKSTRHTVVGCDGNEHPIAVLSPVISLAGKQP